MHAIRKGQVCWLAKDEPAGARTIEDAQRYLEEEFLPRWNQHLVVAPANPSDAHRPLGPERDLAATLSQVETRLLVSKSFMALSRRRSRPALSAIWHVMTSVGRGLLCHERRGELEQIQFLLGHVSDQTTERYLGCKQRLRDAVNDSIGIEPQPTRG